MGKLKLPNKFGSISKLSGNRRKRYMVRLSLPLDENGKQKRLILGYYTTYNEAYKALIEYSSTPLNIEDAKTFTINVLFERFKKEKEETVSKETFKRYTRSFIDFNYLFDKQVREIKYDDIQKTLSKQVKAKSLSSLVVWNWIFEESIKLDIINKNIATHLKASNKVTKTIERTIYSSEIINNIWKLTLENNFVADILICLLYSGLRISELLEITRENVHIKDRYLIAGKKTLAGKNRVVPIHKRIIPIIEKYLKISEETSSKILLGKYNQNGFYGKINSASFRYYFYDFMEKLNIKMNIHSTRHTFISKMKSLEVNDSKLKRIVGHKGNDITDNVYTIYSAEDLIPIIDLLEY
ncbi:tyrosine-type recombinase/integrase [Streptobacillus moniliformis]|uniref:Integrase family protein n=1 Tax=Streptobacillus moniliformis (strain ATCC 14647 / DSM 12112 / NCTC 10651 / 9901) TaxID=519441 RepID=D1AYK2_STRM9|nr:site-specific integrase [Streptobacillus moniliformis]ACZ01378.1 integrase family protein [Streptobacillus moniliformis DSM 12112]AVL43609.1 site-specific integrase [Streptobacillus moniliformis]SQA13462.1 site-specific tyrosine recombinase XerC [Streptobacillus moniliformis]